MVASARIAYLARRGQDYGVHTGGDVRVNMAGVYRRKQDIVEQFRNGGQHSLESTPNVELLFGEASFVDAKTARVVLNAGSERLLTAPAQALALIGIDMENSMALKGEFVS